MKPTPEQVEHRRLWIAALRSGEFQQTTGTMERRIATTVEHCCLGVACRTAMQHGIRLSVSLVEGANPRAQVAFFDGACGVLPTKVVKWLGSNRDDPHWESIAASVLNDSGKTFEGIADLAERHLTEPW